MQDTSFSNNISLKRFFPFLVWLKGYGAASFKSDAVSGLTGAVILIPQSMAYAMLAGLPPVYGLYAAAITPLIAGLWGSLRQLATGPIAIMGILVLSTLTPMAEPESARFIELTFVLSFIIGAIYLLIGIFRFGMIMSFISHSTVRGFTSAAALIIVSTQIPHLLGIKIRRHEYIISTLIDIISNISHLHVMTCIIGFFCMALILLLKRINRNLPTGLIALSITIIITYVFQLQESGVAIVGNIPEGMPGMHIPRLNLNTVSSLIGSAFVIALVNFANTYALEKVISSKTKQKVDVNQELIGQGLANFVGSFFQCCPVGGSFARTVINFETGAKTGISSVISSIVASMALLFLTHLFTYIPKAALAAIVIIAVLSLFHPREILVIWKMNRHDGIVAVSVFVLALLIKPDFALLIGIVLSLILFMWHIMRPRIVRVTKAPSLNMFVNADLYSKPVCPQILQLRPDNAIFFANAEYVANQIIKHLDEQKTPVKFLLLDFQTVAFIDMTGIYELDILLDEIKQHGVTPAFVDIHYPVRTIFQSSGLSAKLDPSFLIERKDRAINFLFQRLDHEYCSKICPYKIYYECSTIK